MGKNLFVWGCIILFISIIIIQICMSSKTSPDYMDFLTAQRPFRQFKNGTIVRII